jgi:putative transposase
MKPISYKRHRFPPDVIRHAVWLYFRFPLSLRDVEALPAERGIEVSYEAIRCWSQKFGVQFARNLRRSRPKPTGCWHLDEMVVGIGGRRMFLWRAVDNEGEVLDLLVQRRRHKRAAVRLLRKLLKTQGIHPEAIVTDKLGSYGAAAKAVGLPDRHTPADSRRTTGRKTRTCRSASGSASSRGSRARDRPSASCRPRVRSTTPSISSPT